jgi:hypothetical protein
MHGIVNKTHPHSAALGTLLHCGRGKLCDLRHELNECAAMAELKRAPETGISKKENDKSRILRL